MFNPLFGRKILKRSKGFLVSTRNEKPKFRVTYQTKYIPFDKIKIESVVHDHHENENSEYIFPPLNPHQNIIPNHKHDFIGHMKGIQVVSIPLSARIIDS